MTFIPYGAKTPYKFKYLKEADKRSLKDMEFIRNSLMNLTNNLENYFDDDLLEMEIGSEEEILSLIDNDSFDSEDEKMTIQKLLEVFLDCCCDWIDMDVCMYATGLVDEYDDEYIDSLNIDWEQVRKDEKYPFSISYEDIYGGKENE